MDFPGMNNSDVASSCQRLSLKRKRRESIHNGIFGNSNGKNPLKRACSSFLQFSLKDLGAIFDHYSCGTEMIESKGMLQFCKDLGVNTMDVALLVLSYQMSVAECGVFTRQEFINGLSNLGLFSMQLLKEALPSLRQYALTHFNEIYIYAFHSLKEYESQLTIPLDGALEMIRILTTHLPHGLNFIHFMKTQNHEYLGMNFDQWTMFLQFNLQISMDFENYDENGCWPVMIDDFVLYMRSEEKSLEEPGSYYENTISFETQNFSLCSTESSPFSSPFKNNKNYTSLFNNHINNNNNSPHNPDYQREDANLFSSFPYQYNHTQIHNEKNENDNDHFLHNYKNSQYLVSSSPNHNTSGHSSMNIGLTINHAESTGSNSLFSSSFNHHHAQNNLHNQQLAYPQNNMQFHSSNNLMINYNGENQARNDNILFSTFHNQNNLFLHKEDSCSDSCSEIDLGGMDVM